MMLPQEIIRAKRDGETLSAGEIGDFIVALTSGAVTEGQAAAFAMAIYFSRHVARRACGADAGDDPLGREPRLARKQICRARSSTSTRPAASATMSR